jgi:DNA-binding NtrC family response regulator
VLRFLEHQEGGYDRAFLVAGVNGVGPARELAREMRAHVADVQLRAVELQDPSDYGGLFRELGPIVTEVGRALEDGGGEVDVLLSAGTPQVQTLWVILVQAGLLRARMYQVIPPAFVPHPHPRPIREVTFDIEGFPEIRVLRDEVERLRAEVRTHQSKLIATGGPMRRLLDRLPRVAASDLPVLVLGETGTGKELVARTLHQSSRRSAGPFVAENCAALAEGVLASELFGHEAGAFTGATQRRRGLFEQAHGGTIFLDEVGEMPAQVQAMLLRVLQEGVIRRVGSETWIKVDVRVVAATHRDLREMIDQGRFREDLYYRLQGVSLDVPPLRERTSDLSLLIDVFARETTGSRRRPLRITREAMRILEAHRWPGNVRELRSEVLRWSVFSDQSVDVDDLSPEIRAGIEGKGSPPEPSSRGARRKPRELTLSEQVRDVERNAVQTALSLHDGNLTRAAAALGIERNTLKRKLSAFGVSRSKR